MSGDHTAADSDDPWPVLDRVVEYDVGWFTAGYDLVERPGGDRAKYYWIDPPDAATVVPITDDGEVVLVEQYRPRQGRRLLECPGGGVDPDEDPVAAGRRELREETGYRADSVERLHTYTPSGWVRYERTVMAATGLTAGDRDLDDGEVIDVRTVPADRALELAREPPSCEWLLTPLLLARDAGLL